MTEEATLLVTAFNRADIGNRELDRIDAEEAEIDGFRDEYRARTPDSPDAWDAQRDWEDYRYQQWQEAQDERISAVVLR